MDVGCAVGTDHLLGRVAEHALYRRANVAHGPVRVGDHDDIQRILGEGVEPPFAVRVCLSSLLVVIRNH
jgi:hypothetical protein